ncbi:MAG: FAD-binding oxidoreductase [Anaerolineae bacterium]|nr:FAD-binding oxidoreductase [Anaerolineae bacterium]
MILVIGAGLTGAMIAHRLANLGHSVAVFDAQTAAKGATRLTAGLVLADPSPDNNGDTTYGMDRLAQLAMSHQVGVRRMKASIAISDTQPFATTIRIIDTQPALVMSLDTLARALLNHNNITLRENIEIQQIEQVDGRLNVLGNGYTVQADHVVLATGAYSGLLAPEISPFLDIGRSVTWISKPLDKKFNLTLPLIIENGKMSVAQTQDQRVRINVWHSAAEQNAILAQQSENPDESTSVNLVNAPNEDVRRFLRRFLREINNENESHQNGMVVSTRDNAPIVGNSDHIPGLIYAIPPHVYGPAWTPIMAEWVEGLITAPSR